MLSGRWSHSRFLQACFIGAASLSLLRCATQTPGRQYQAMDAYKEGIEAGQQGDVSAAVTKLEKAVKLEPNFPEAWFNLAVGYEKLKENDYALFAYTQAVQHEPEFMEAHLGLMEQLAAKGQFARALEEAQWVLERDLYIPSLHVRTAYLLEALNLPEQAFEHMSQVVRMSPFNVTALMWLGHRYKKKQKWELAQGVLIQAHSIQKADPDILFEIIECSVELGRRSEANQGMKELKRLTKQQPTWKKRVAKLAQRIRKM